MKVVLLVDSLVNGGLERQLALVATSLPSTWEARVWTMGGGPYLEHFRTRGVPVLLRERRARLDPSPVVQLARDLRAWRPDVVHSWSWMTALAAVPVCRVLKLPNVDGMIRSGALEPDFTGLKRYGMASATLVLANSKAGLRAWGIGPDRGRVIYNGFDTSRLPSSFVRRDDLFTVIMTGRMEPEKHYSVVLAAARHLAATPGWRFVLVGSGSDRERLVSAADDLIRAGVVSFVEATPDPLPLVATADVGVLMTNPAYRDEGLSNSVMEYMALRLPVVCGEGGGNRELVLDGQTGFVIPPGNPAALADRLRQLRSDDDLRRRLGEAGRRRILDEFSVDAMIQGMIGVYEEAQGRARSRSVG